MYIQRERERINQSARGAQRLLLVCALCLLSTLRDVYIVGFFLQTLSVLRTVGCRHKLYCVPIMTQGSQYWIQLQLLRIHVVTV